MCGGSMCHGNPAPPAGSSYNASGNGFGTYLEYYRVPQDYLEFLAECPVDIQVIDPLGRIVDKFQNEIPGAEYLELDFNNDGSLDDKIIVPKLDGNYTVSVFPEPGANPQDTYTLKVMDGADMLILARDRYIWTISDEDISEVTVTSSGLKFIKLRRPDNGESLSKPVPFHWTSRGFNGFRLQFSTDKNFGTHVVTFPRGFKNLDLKNLREFKQLSSRVSGKISHQWNWLTKTTYLPTPIDWLLTNSLLKSSTGTVQRGLIYWRVIAIDEEGNTGSSEIRSFILESARSYQDLWP
jgi:hypothetical protein